MPNHIVWLFLNLILVTYFMIIVMLNPLSLCLILNHGPILKLKGKIEFESAWMLHVVCLGEKSVMWDFSSDRWRWNFQQDTRFCWISIIYKRHEAQSHIKFKALACLGNPIWLTEIIKFLSIICLYLQRWCDIIVYLILTTF